MTAHELAQTLLGGPDLPVVIFEYDGGRDTLFEVEDVLLHRESDGEVALLQTCLY